VAWDFVGNILDMSFTCPGHVLQTPQTPGHAVVLR
jgi:hypothetical protein